VYLYHRFKLDVYMFFGIVKLYFLGPAKN
jgi:hypothetical protein